MLNTNHIILQAAGTLKGVKRGSAPIGKRSKFPKIAVSSDSEFENAGTAATSVY